MKGTHCGVGSVLPMEAPRIIEEGEVVREMTSVCVQGKAAPEIAAQIDQQRDLQVNALKQFDASLKALVIQADRAQVAAN